jgi:tetratricopeptide (TPR) repeat protein
VANAWYQAGRDLLDKNELKLAVEALRKALALRPDHADTYLNLAEALRLKSWTPRPPYVIRDEVEQSLAVWELAAQRKVLLGGEADSWAYMARAALNEQLARVPGNDRWALGWEAVSYCERALAYDSEDCSRCLSLARWYRYLLMDACEDRATAVALRAGPYDVDALEERIICLTNAGRFADVETLLQKRRERDISSWPDAIEAFIKFHTGQPGEAFELIQKGLKDLPEALWCRLVRAECLEKLGRPSEAVSDYRWILERYDPEDWENQSLFASTAYRLGLREGRMEQAVELYTRIHPQFTLPTDASVRIHFGLCYLAVADFVRGERLLEEGLTLTANLRVLANLLHSDLIGLEEASSSWAHGEKLRALLNSPTAGIKARVRARLAKAQESRVSHEEELGYLQSSRPFGDADGWLRIGVQAGLARSYTASKRWNEASQIYVRLLRQEQERFPEARLGLEKAADGLTLSADELLKSERLDAASTAYSEVLALLKDVEISEPKRLAGLQSRLALVALLRANLAAATEHSVRTLQLFQEAEVPDPGKELGDLWRSLVPGISYYWRVCDAWPDLGRRISSTDSTLQTAARQAHRTFDAYLEDVLKDVYKLAASSGFSAEMLPLVTPISMEVGQLLIPFFEEDECRLFKQYIAEMRDDILKETGVLMPGVRVRGNETDLPQETYIILLDEVPIVTGTVKVGKYYCLASRERLRELAIEAIKEQSHPLTGEPGCWVEPDDCSLAATHGLKVLPHAAQFAILHLENVLRRNLAGFLGVEEMESLLKEWGKDEGCAALMKEALHDHDARLRFARMLRQLVKERVPITNAKEILQAVQDADLTQEHVNDAVRAARLRLKSQLPGNQLQSKRIELPVDLEERIAGSMKHELGKSFLAISLEEALEMQTEIRELVEVRDRHSVLVAQDARIRPFVRRLVELQFPDVMVIARQELLTPENCRGSEQSTKPPLLEHKNGK